jgi:predicted nucleic acid-binding protein
VSYSLDVNILLYASDRASAQHVLARDFVESCAAGPEILCLTWPTLLSYLRIATHPRISQRRCRRTKRLENI